MDYSINDGEMNFKKVLVIDDEVEIGLLLSTLLNKLGLDAVYANNLDMGVKMFEEIKPHVVFLDLNLPDGSGFSVVPHMKNQSYNPRIVVITAQDGPKERTMAAHLGIDYIMPKPLSRNNVIEVLQYLGNSSIN